MSRDRSATYRLQLDSGFGFEQAAALIGYLAELGISHLYVSPVLQAAKGSPHGYDVVDPSRVNRELGGEQGFFRLHNALDSAGLGLLLDVVPNHMAIGGRENPWWWDVLENGSSSPYAQYFDVDWDASEERWPNKVLLPVLGDHYGRILETDQFRVSHTAGTFTLAYHDHLFPIDPTSLPELLHSAAKTCDSAFLGFLARSHARLPRPTATADRRTVDQRHQDKQVLAFLLTRLCKDDPAVSAALDSVTARINEDHDALDRLIDQQNYRPAFWRAASRDLGYRRFFDINELGGLRAERREVFRDTHYLPIDWVRKGMVQGLRVDHPDGLRDPTEYFQRLRQSCPEAWIVVEKILETDEKLPPDWAVEGTTGYDFLNLVNGLFIDPRGKNGLTRCYETFSGRQSDPETLVLECKRQVIAELLASELSRLTSLFIDVCERHRRHRDYGRDELRRALAETAACFPVYRSYLSPARKPAGRRDSLHITAAIDRAGGECPDLDPELFGFLKQILQGRISGPLEMELALRFQQLTGPVMAKGVEDTFFYRHHRLAAINEVGGDPTGFGTSPARFHRICAQSRTEHPFSLLASTTHDTKRSEDVRARLALLSEIPEQWSQAVTEWGAHNARHRHDEFPDRNTEYLLYQTLVGAWPIETERLAAYMEKAVRESKEHTSWLRQNEPYESSLQEFIKGIMDDTLFCDKVRTFVAGLEHPGRVNSLGQLLLKLTAPGVPDIFQGTELWTMTLVDPDNRRPVDFDACRAALTRVRSLAVEEILARMDQGLPKIWTMHQTLDLRRRRPELFGATGTYTPLRATGPKAGHVVAFIRGTGGVCVVPRLILGCNGDWKDTRLDIPSGSWRNLLTGEVLTGGDIPIGDLLRRFPVALLEQETKHA